jgi:hypothetical protein
MVGLLSFIGVVVGACVAHAAQRFPAHLAALETVAGILLLGGFGLLGWALAAACCH